MKLFSIKTLSAALVLLSGIGSVLSFSPTAFRAPYSASASSRRSALFLADKSPPQEQQQRQSGNHQKEYGDTLDLPDSYARCGRCQTVYAITEDDLGRRGKGCRLECSVCGHSWFQSRDRLLTIRDGFEMVPLPDTDKERILLNIEEGKTPSFVGDMKLYVGNIAFECVEDDLVEVFEEAGTVGEVSLVKDDDGRNRGFGFITMRTKQGGEKAMEILNGKEVKGRTIAVREANN